jgi:hypothetical protein
MAMPKFVIEREIPQRREVADRGAAVTEILRSPEEHGPKHKVAADDTIYCIYIARDEEAVRQHAMIDPTTAEV